VRPSASGPFRQGCLTCSRTASRRLVRGARDSPLRRTRGFDRAKPSRSRRAFGNTNGTDNRHGGSGGGTVNACCGQRRRVLCARLTEMKSCLGNCLLEREPRTFTLLDLVLMTKLLSRRRHHALVTLPLGREHPEAELSLLIFRHPPKPCCHTLVP